MLYKVPENHFFRIHHARPRFKNDVESVLLFVCQRISNLTRQPSSEYDHELFKMLKSYPGNMEKADKTIHNWRTEISALFGLIITEGHLSSPGTYAQLLAKNEDLVEFFRYFLLTFQYPGGHIKPERVAQQIEANIRFHPAKSIIEVFFEGQQILGDEEQFAVTSAEITSLMFNDLRFTATKTKTPKEVAKEILKNRKGKIQYDQSGDVVRYAQDILDYMVLGDILTKRANTNTYHFKPKGQEVALKISERAPSFKGYEAFYGKGLPDTTLISQIEDEWMAFVNEDRVSKAFVGDILSILETDGDEQFNLQVEGLVESLRMALSGGAHDIGRAGESVVISHEKSRLSRLGQAELAKKVKKIPDFLGVGYDIMSFEGISEIELEELCRYIEVKTTRSKRLLVNNSFTMTPNEWKAARTLGDSYFIYRLIISEGALRMFVIKNPYRQETIGTLTMTPRNGAEISYTENSGVWEEILVSTKLGVV